jgi:HSP20 family molecular chaperone IbpA
VPGWDPSGDLAAIQQEMNRLFEGFLGHGAGRVQSVEGSWAPPMDVCETQTDLRILVELPGIPQKIEIVEGTLTIRGRDILILRSGRTISCAWNGATDPFPGA